jgi:hypothetical protein
MLAGAGIGAVFIRSGLRKGDAALIDFALFRNRAYSAAVLSNFLLNGAIGTMMIASIWLQQGTPDPLESGMMTRLSGDRPGDDPGREAAAALRRAAADDDRPGLYRRRHSAYLLHLSR